MKRLKRIKVHHYPPNKGGRKINFFKIPLFILFVSAVSILIFLQMNFYVFIIKTVEVNTEKLACTDSNKIKESSKLLGQNFFFVNSSKITVELISQYLCIRSLSIDRIFPNKIRLNVFGRVPSAILVPLKLKEATESSILEEFAESISSESAKASESAKFSEDQLGEKLVVDSDGFIFSKNSESFSVPKIYIIGQDLDLQLGKKLHQDTITNALEIFDKLADLVSDLKEAKIYSEKVFLVNASAKLVFKLDGKVDSQLASLQLILSKAKIDEDKIEFIDLRFDKPVVRFAPKKK